MALSRVQSVFTFSTSSGGQTYLYDIVVDAQSSLAVRNIRGPRGLVTDSLTQLPEIVVQDIQDAMGIVQLQTDETEVVSGTITFDGDTSITVAIPGGTLNNTQYRVVYTTPDGTLLRTESKTTTSFVAVAPSAYGAADDEKEVDYVVYASTVQASSTGGTLTFTSADNSQKVVTFAQALPSADYRVLLSPSDFFTAKYINKTKQGFTVVLGITLAVGQTVTVGYDVII